MDENVWLEINLDNLGYNLNKVRGLVNPAVKVMAVIKQNAYGLGFLPAAKFLEKKRVDFLGVNNSSEAERLINNRIKTPILILSNTISSRGLKELVKNKVRFTLTEESLLNLLGKASLQAGRKALVHIKTDTGMGRLGIPVEKAVSFIEKAVSFKNICVEGLYSHFSSAESNPAYTLSQIKKFIKLTGRLRDKGINIPLRHICNSSGAVNFPQAHFDMVRTGIILYGVKPGKKVDVVLKPVLSLKARVVYLKKIMKGAYVSYGNTFKASRDTEIGIISCGYAYGYPWNLSGKAEVIIKGRKYKVVGRVCMDHMMVDLTPSAGKVKLGDEAILIGREGKSNILAEDLAEKAGTIPYEILTGLSNISFRKYLDTQAKKSLV